MRRAVDVTALVLGCDLCGQEVVLPIGDTLAVQAWHRQHMQPKLVRLMAEADCDCAD